MNAISYCSRELFQQDNYWKSVACYTGSFSVVAVFIGIVTGFLVSTRLNKSISVVVGVGTGLLALMAYVVQMTFARQVSIREYEKLFRSYVAEMMIVNPDAKQEVVFQIATDKATNSLRKNTGL